MLRGLIVLLFLLVPSIVYGQTVLFFTAENCPPCRDMYPVVQNLQSQNENIFILDVAHNKGLVKKFNITKTPTFVVYQSGKPAGKTIGSKTRSELLELCRLSEIERREKPILKSKYFEFKLVK